ncbi:hypothetical protein BC830DRAFT_919723 [Chytriomyces sp. MP71]|nr:hypothetical protein BC830DRAFT_919723 [Chytriomyces sp. MP71]
MLGEGVECETRTRILEGEHIAEFVGDVHHFWVFVGGLFIVEGVVLVDVWMELFERGETEGCVRGRVHARRLAESSVCVGCALRLPSPTHADEALPRLEPETTETSSRHRTITAPSSSSEETHARCSTTRSSPPAIPSRLVTRDILENLLYAHMTQCIMIIQDKRHHTLH